MAARRRSSTTRTALRCAGVDGCRGGWVLATRAGASTVVSIRDVFAMGFDVVAIDMPIGIPDAARRPSEAEARRYLSPRSSTIFPTPPRACLDARDYAHACELSMAARGVRMSKQTWHIVDKIREVDIAVRDAVAHDPAFATDSVVEAHPECSFLTMNNGVHIPSKHTAAGLTARVELIERTMAITPTRPPSRRDSATPVAFDDVLDAYAVLWTAERFAAGTHRTFPNGPLEFDGLNLPMRIVV